jgi:NAD(P) transhydrogenase subunit alpha
MYSRNVYNLLSLLIKEKELHLNFEDDIVKGCCITHEGKTVFEG